MPPLWSFSHFPICILFLETFHLLKNHEYVIIILFPHSCVKNLHYCQSELLMVAIVLVSVQIISKSTLNVIGATFVKVKILLPCGVLEEWQRHTPICITNFTDSHELKFPGW